MKNQIQKGDIIEVTAPADGLTGGDIFVSGFLRGVVHKTVAEGELGEVQTCGVFELPKVTGTAWTLGAKVYWTGTNCTLTASGNDLIGIAVAAAASGDALGAVKLGSTL